MTSTFTAASPALRHDALASVRTRRILALVVDFMIVGVLAAVLYSVLLILTLGLSFFFLPPLFPLVAFFYNGFSVSGPKMGTLGMRADGPRDALGRIGRTGSFHQRRRARGVVLS